jgi:hypothetical protein
VKALSSNPALPKKKRSVNVLDFYLSFLPSSYPVVIVSVPTESEATDRLRLLYALNPVGMLETK